MPAVVRRRVVSPFFAFKPAANSRAFVTIARGWIIETLGDLEEPGLQSIKVGDQELFAFTRDINERSEMVASDESVLSLDRHNI
jgi:hypothetical protein